MRACEDFSWTWALRSDRHDAFGAFLGDPTERKTHSMLGCRTLRSNALGEPQEGTQGSDALVEPTAETGAPVHKGIEMQKLVCFAVSVFWKASARPWRAVDHTTQLEFGPYLDRFRNFLLGQEPFPDRAAMIINVSGNPVPHIGAISLTVAVGC